MQFDVTSNPSSAPPPPPPGPRGVADLLQQMLDVQKESLQMTRALVALQDTNARWRTLVSRWRQDFPELPDTCKEVLPQLERAYGTLIHTLVEELRDQGEESLDSEFSLQEFLDRYGMRLGQLGHILNLVGPLAEMAPGNANGT